jgi:RNA polymerase sigma-70 factor, ECF subfamily
VVPIDERDFPSVLTAARLGAESAWTIIYRELSPQVARYLRAHSAPEPDDVLGDVFVQVVKGLPSFEGDLDEFRAWVLTIARNRLIDGWRRDSRRPVDPASDELHNGSWLGGDSEDEAMRNLGDANVRAIVERLSPDQRDVLFLRVLVGLPVQEVATVVGKTTGAVKSLQSRAIASIRRGISSGAVSFWLRMALTLLR